MIKKIKNSMNYIFGVLGIVMSIFAGIYLTQKLWTMFIISIILMIIDAYLFVILH